MLCHSSGTLQRGLQEVLVWTPVQCEQGLQEQPLSLHAHTFGLLGAYSQHFLFSTALSGGGERKECPVRNPSQLWLPDLCFTHLVHSSLAHTNHVDVQVLCCSPPGCLLCPCRG